MTIHKCDICGNEKAESWHTIRLAQHAIMGRHKRENICDNCWNQVEVKHEEISDITIEYKKQIKITDKWYFDELKRLILGD